MNLDQLLNRLGGKLSTWDEKCIEDIGKDSLPFNPRITQRGTFYRLQMDRFDLIDKTARKNYYNICCKEKGPLVQLVQDKVVWAYYKQASDIQIFCNGELAFS